MLLQTMVDEGVVWEDSACEVDDDYVYEDDLYYFSVPESEQSKVSTSEGKEKVNLSLTLQTQLTYSQLS